MPQGHANCTDTSAIDCGNTFPNELLHLWFTTMRGTGNELIPAEKATPADRTRRRQHSNGRSGKERKKNKKNKVAMKTKDREKYNQKNM